jgi:hypothetical protein
VDEHISWTVRTCWVASFDILGFKNLVNVDGGSIKAHLIRGDYERALEHLKDAAEPRSLGKLEYFWLSDTFVMYTEDDSALSYSVIQRAAKYFVEECLYSHIPIRGAISVGSLSLSSDNRAVMGEAFIDAFVTGEDQDWLGLLLSERAVARAQALGLEPSRHDFVASGSVPMRKCDAHRVMAYRFQNGAANFSSPLLPVLEAMRASSAAPHHPKYERTIEFIKVHYRKLA